VPKHRKYWKLRCLGVSRSWTNSIQPVRDDLEWTALGVSRRGGSIPGAGNVAPKAVSSNSFGSFNTSPVPFGRSKHRVIHAPTIRRSSYKGSRTINSSLRRSCQSSTNYTFHDPYVRRCGNSSSSVRRSRDITPSIVGPSGSGTSLFQWHNKKERMENVRSSSRTHSSRPAIQLGSSSIGASRLLYDGTLQQRCWTHARRSRRRLTFAEPLLPCELSNLSHSAAFGISLLYHGPCKANSSYYTRPTSALNSLREDDFMETSMPLLKGSFTPLDYRRIALPSDPQCMPDTWIQFLSPNVQKYLSSPKCSQAGMIEWSRIGHEPSHLRRMRDALTMSSFGVTKDEDSDRLISWPRIQNEWFLPPPVPSFPDPSAFTRVFADESPNGAGFALDVANMFHNIRLPPWMTSLFPLTPLLYKDMPSDLKVQIMSILNMSAPPPDYTSFRPLQRTLPMGFTWAAFLGHAIAEGCLHGALDSFKRSTDLTYRTITLSGLLRVVEPMAGLPIRARKCTPLNRIETKSLPFIGFNWDLQSGSISPKGERTSNLSRSIDHLLDFPSSYQEKDVERIVGKLVWTSMARRPLLSILRSAFHLPSDQPLRVNRITAERELRIISSLLPLAIIDTKRKIWPIALATDASNPLGAVTFTRSTRNDLLALLSTCRYNDGPLSHRNASFFALNSTWETALTHEWRREEHINVLEGESILLGVRWAIEKGAGNHRVVLMSDSSVCVGALTKGRSSSSGLLRVCRKIAALSLLHKIELIPVHLSTDDNPADAPSRGQPIELRFR